MAWRLQILSLNLSNPRLHQENIHWINRSNLCPQRKLASRSTRKIRTKWIKWPTSLNKWMWLNIPKDRSSQRSKTAQEVPLILLSSLWVARLTTYLSKTLAAFTSRWEKMAYITRTEHHSSRSSRSKTKFSSRYNKPSLIKSKGKSKWSLTKDKWMIK